MIEPWRLSQATQIVPESNDRRLFTAISKERKDGVSTGPPANIFLFPNLLCFSPRPPQNLVGATSYEAFLLVCGPCLGHPARTLGYLMYYPNWLLLLDQARANDFFFSLFFFGIYRTCREKR